jgi:transposase
LDPNENFTHVCKDFGISTKTGYKWKARFETGGWSALAERSRRPRKNTKQLSEESICDIISIKTTKLRWGAPKIRKVYENLYPKGSCPL